MVLAQILSVWCCAVSHFGSRFFAVAPDFRPACFFGCVAVLAVHGLPASAVFFCIFFYLFSAVRLFLTDCCSSVSRFCNIFTQVMRALRSGPRAPDVRTPHSQPLSLSSISLLYFRTKTH